MRGLVRISRCTASQIGSGGIFSIGSTGTTSGSVRGHVVGDEAHAQAGAHRLPVGDQVVGAKREASRATGKPKPAKPRRMVFVAVAADQVVLQQVGGWRGVPRRRR